MTQKLEIIGVQKLHGAEFSKSTVIEFPEEMTAFFMAVNEGSWKFERKDGHYILTLNN